MVLLVRDFREGWQGGTASKQSEAEHAHDEARARRA